MTTDVDVVNRALQSFGTRTTVTTSELANNTSNEAIQANISLHTTRKELLRMAPWDCGLVFNNLTYITSAPGTPENQSAATETWQRGQPAPPWLYEYQYPVDCLKACWVIPIFNTGFAGSTPIYPVQTGLAPFTWNGPGVRFKVATDLFYPVTAATVAAGGTGHAVGDLITLATTVAGTAPIGAPVVLRVATVAGGVILTVTVVNQVLDASPSAGGSYFRVQTNPVAQSATTGSGINATFNLTFGAQASQRVILTNQEDATLAYIRDQVDINVMDPLFIEAWAEILGARIVMGLTGDKTLANMCIERSNKKVVEARTADGNEGLTVNDRTPDWMRVRGIAFSDGGSQGGYDWGGLWPSL